MTKFTTSPLRPQFETTYSALSGDSTELGEIALLPWDAEIFGFAVADYRPGEARAMGDRAESLGPALRSWAAGRSVDLVGCRVPAGPARAMGAILEAAGFRFVEVQLRATIPHLRPADAGPSRLTVRSAEDTDHARLSHIAGSAFSIGRYHADPLFPRELADRRYRIWIERALADSVPDSWIAVVGPPGSPFGFLQAEITGSSADIRLAAVDREGGGIAGPELFRGALHEFARRGVKRVTAQISAANTGVLNIYCSLGFRFHEPELVFHWHRPGARSMVSLARAIEQDGIHE